MEEENDLPLTGDFSKDGQTKITLILAIAVFFYTSVIFFLNLISFIKTLCIMRPTQILTDVVNEAREPRNQKKQRGEEGQNTLSRELIHAEIQWLFECLSAKASCPVSDKERVEK